MDRIIGMRMRTFTKRKAAPDAISDAAALQRTMNRLRGYALIPKGLYRFKTMEESDQWMTQNIAATHAHLNSKT